MSKFWRWVLDWTEVWALFIPLGFLLFRNKQPAFLKPVIIYLWIALFLNLAGDIIGDYYKYLPKWLQSNNSLYNLHSIIRFVCFASFFIALKQPYFKTIKKLLPLISLAFVVVNFGFFEDFFYYDNLSGNLLSVEAYLLLIYCMLYYLAELKDEDEVAASGPGFWVTTGLCIYVVINFFVFLFYVPMRRQNGNLADNMWYIHNVAYIILCVCIAKAFYVSARPDYRT